MKRFCIIGNGDHETLSALHLAGMAEFEIEGQVEYVPVAENELQRFLQTQVSGIFDGVIVLGDFQRKVFHFLENCTDMSRKTGIVNTILVKEGVLVGTNTAPVGILKSVLTAVDPKGKNILIFGANALAESAVFGLKDLSKNMVLFDDDQIAVQHVAEKYGVSAGENKKILKGSVLDIVINTTDIGNGKWESVISQDFWSSNVVALDNVYTPLQTKFLSDAEESGAQIVSGDKLCIYSAIAQFEVFHEIKPEPEVFELAFFG